VATALHRPVLESILTRTLTSTVTASIWSDEPLTMRDLTIGSVPRHLIALAIPMGIGLVFQTIYVMVDLYFVSQLGSDAVAGVSITGNLMLLTIALAQILSIGVTALISQATGRKDQEQANHVFNQGLQISTLLMVLTLVLGYLLAPAFVGALSAAPETERLGGIYLHWFLPHLALQFAMNLMSSALRGTGVVKPATVVQLVGVLLNIVLTPILVSGWVTGKPMGVMGAGLSSSLSALVATLLMTYYFFVKARYLSIRLGVAVDFSVWRRILSIGFPSGAEFMMMFGFMSVVYWAISGFGAHSQAGYGIAQRVMQVFFMPALALSFAAPAIVGQNRGAGERLRIRQTYHWLLGLSLGVMGVLGLGCWLFAPSMMRWFTSEQDVIGVGIQFLRMVSWNFLTTAFVISAGAVFQGIGNTWPALVAATVRAAAVVLSILWIRQLEGYVIEWVWWIAVLAVALQAIICTRWVMRVLNREAPVVRPLA